MPRTRRLIINDETAVYHVMSRTALDGFPLGDVQTNNRDDFLSTDFGLKEFNPPSADKCLKSRKERIRMYRRYVYEAGALDRSSKTSAGVIDNNVLDKERKNNFELKRVRRFRYRTRYFTDSGIIGTK